MPRYHTLGNIPPKRHTVFKKPNGDFYFEELFGTIGFDGMSSLLYHTQRPTQVKEVVKSYSVEPKIAVAKNMKSISLKGYKVPPINDFLESRKCVLMNSDCQITLAAPKQSLTEYFYKNTDSDEVIF
ncbi:MAG: homogentisate 1,2-dioxygenase, partial [Flavobacteriales bacterium]